MLLRRWLSGSTHFGQQESPNERKYHRLFLSTYSIFKLIYFSLDPSMTFVFKAASHGCPLCVTGDWLAASRLSPGFRVKVGKPRNTPFSCFLHTAPCCSVSTTGLFSRHVHHRLPSRPNRKAHGPQGTFVLLLFDDIIAHTFAKVKPLPRCSLN